MFSKTRLMRRRDFLRVYKIIKEVLKMYIILVLMVAVVVSTITAGIVLHYKGKESFSSKARKLIKVNLSVFAPLAALAVILVIPEAVFGATEAAASDSAGLGYIAAALSTGLATIATGIAVGSVGSSALGAVSEEPGMLGRSLIFVGLAEGIAIYGLIISIMILGRI